MCIVAGHQPNLYPYAGFFAKAATVGKFVIADTTQYVKKEYHNRNRIKLLNGKTAWLSIPVKNSGNFKQKINEAEIDNSVNWRKKHEKSLLVNYRKASYFKTYAPEFSALYAENWRMLSDFNTAFIELCFKLLGITTPLYKASELGVTGASTSYILDICRKTSSDTYMHGRHAYDYVDFTMLKDQGIKNIIQIYDAVEYPQVSGEFIPNLSVIDILFNCGPESMNIIIRGHTVKEQ